MLDSKAFDVIVTVNKLTGDTAQASFTLRIHPEWAPLGADRFSKLVDDNFFNECRFFRVISGFMGQFGINGDPSKMKTWNGKTIRDDPQHLGVGNTRGKITFATSGPDSRTTQLFINFQDNSFLNKMGFTPIGEVIDGMHIVDRLYMVGEGAPQGPGPSQGAVQSMGNAYLEREFPQLTYIVSVQRVARGFSPSSKHFLAHNSPLSAARTTVHCELTVGSIHIEVHPEWGPLGAARFLELVEAQYLDGTALFRAISNFLVQFGIGARKPERDAWNRKPPIKDDPLRPDIPVKFGTMAFAGGGKHSRTFQMWIALADNQKQLGTEYWETPFAQVVGDASMATLRKINTEYGDRPQQGSIWTRGYDYLAKEFPRLDYIRTCRVMKADPVQHANQQNLSATSLANRVPEHPEILHKTDEQSPLLPDGFQVWLVGPLGAVVLLGLICQCKRRVSEALSTPHKEV